MSDGRFLWRLLTAGLLASELLSALKALSAPAGGSQLVCIPAQVPSACWIVCAVDEHDRDGEGEMSLKLFHWVTSGLLADGASSPPASRRGNHSLSFAVPGA